MELKVIGGGPSHYARDDVRRCFAVAARASLIPGEYRAKALRLDHLHCNVPEGTPGPVTMKLASYGRIWGLAFGAYAEASPDVHELLDVLASSCASRQWARMGSRDSQDAAATLKGSLYRSWGLMAARGQARFKLMGLGHVGTGAAAARARRVSLSLQRPTASGRRHTSCTLLQQASQRW